MCMMYEVLSKNNRYFQFFQKFFIYLSITILLILLRYNTLMPPFFFFFYPRNTSETRFLISPTASVSIFFFLFNRNKKLSFRCCLQFWTEDKGSGAKCGEYSLKSTPNDRFFWETFHGNFILLSEFLPEVCWEEIAKEHFLYSRWGMITVLFLAKNSRTSIDWFSHNSVPFW